MALAACPLSVCIGLKPPPIINPSSGCAGADRVPDRGVRGQHLPSHRAHRRQPAAGVPAHSHLPRHRLHHLHPVRLLQSCPTIYE